MADNPLATLIALLPLSAPEQFRSALVSLISEIVHSEVQAVTVHLESSLQTTKTEYSQYRDTVRSQFDTVFEEIKDFRSELSEIEASRAREAKHISRSKTTLEASESNIGKHLQEIESIKSSLVHLASDLSMKASVNDVNRLTERMAMMCPTLYAQKLEAAIRSKGEELDVRKLEKDVELIQRRLENTVVEKGEVEALIRQLQDNSDRSIKGLVSTHHFARTIDGLERSINIFKKHIEDSLRHTNSDVSDVFVRVTKAATELETKASAESVSKLEAKSLTFVTMDGIDRVNETAERCLVQIEDEKVVVENILKRQDEVLQRYDEIFLDKANKMDLMHVEKRLTQLEELKTMKVKLETLEMDLHTLLGQQSASEHDLHDLDMRLSDFSQSFMTLKSERKDVQSIISSFKSLTEKVDSKADKSDLVVISESKAGKVEIQTVIRSLGVMYRIDKLAIALLNHAIKCISDLSLDASPVTIIAVEWLAKHSELVAAWANSYEPIENEIELPPDITSILMMKSTKTLISRPSLSPLGFNSKRKSPVPSPLPLSTSAQGVAKKMFVRRNETMRKGIGEERVEI